ncbi:MAG: recombinase family protein [Pseudorhodoplanes sp.]
MKAGYARISTKRQRLDLQYRALFDAGCDFIISEIASGHDATRRGLQIALSALSTGDTLSVWKVDRLGRDPIHLMDLARQLRASGIALQVLSGHASLIDISTQEGLGLFAIYAASAGIEHETARARSKAGTDASKHRRRSARRMKEKRRQPVASGGVRLRCSFNRSRSA